VRQTDGQTVGMLMEFENGRDREKIKEERNRNLSCVWRIISVRKVSRLG
jgi:hypothetical protein